MKKIRISLITTIGIFMLICTHISAQIPCNLLTSDAQRTFVNAAQGSNSSFTGNISGSGWTSVSVGTANILETPWNSTCEECFDPILPASAISSFIKNAPNSTDNRMLGAQAGGGIEATFTFEPNQTYLLRFSQVNARRYRSYVNRSSSRWIVKLGGIEVGRSLLMPIAPNASQMNWHESLIVFTTTVGGAQTLSITTDTEETGSNGINIYNTYNTISQTLNYMLIDNIQLFKEGECEYPPVLTKRDNSSFSPSAGNYVVSAWVKEDHASPVISYSSSVEVSFNDGATVSTPISFTPSGSIIEGWQRIEGIFTIPGGSTDIIFGLKNNVEPQAAYFDDIRIHKADGNMKSFVYDPITQRLVAELDENNYATLYEYDKEGGLVRVKKETERGVYTIQETRSGNKKANAQ